MCGLRRLRSYRRRGRQAPGCLTSESEERETWTAESLRAASSNGEGFGFFRESAAMEETSAVDVSGQHCDYCERKRRETQAFARHQSGTSSKWQRESVVTCET